MALPGTYKMANAGWGQVLHSNTAEEVAKALGTPLATLQEQIYTMKRQKSRR